MATFELAQRDAWWRTSWLLAEFHNCSLAMIQTWGGAKDAKPKQPKEMNPLEIASGGKEIVAEESSRAAFALAREREAAKNGKQILN